MSNLILAIVCFILVIVLFLVFHFLILCNEDMCLTTKSISGALILCVIVAVGAISRYCFEEYANEVNGPKQEEPVLDDVASGKAHIDTIITICKKDTTYKYIINWNNIKEE